MRDDYYIFLYNYDMIFTRYSANNIIKYQEYYHNLKQL